MFEFQLISVKKRRAKNHEMMSWVTHKSIAGAIFRDIYVLMMFQCFCCWWVEEFCFYRGLKFVIFHRNLSLLLTLNGKCSETTCCLLSDISQLLRHRRSASSTSGQRRTAVDAVPAAVVAWSPRQRSAPLGTTTAACRHLEVWSLSRTRRMKLTRPSPSQFSHMCLCFFTKYLLALWRPLLPHRYRKAIRHPVPDRVKSSFVIFNIWALWRSGLSVRVPRYQKLQMRV